jgi:hypothetical protein
MKKCCMPMNNYYMPINFCMSQGYCKSMKNCSKPMKIAIFPWTIIVCHKSDVCYKIAVSQRKILQANGEFLYPNERLLHVNGQFLYAIERLLNATMLLYSNETLFQAIEKFLYANERLLYGTRSLKPMKNCSMPMNNCCMQWTIAEWQWTIAAC